MHIWAMECLVYTKSFRICKKKSIYVDFDVSYAKSSKFWKKFRDSATVPSKITIFNFFLFEHILLTKGDLWVPQTWSSVNLLDHKKRFPYSCPISAEFEMCEKRQRFG